MARIDNESSIIFVPEEPDKGAQERILRAIANNGNGYISEGLRKQWPITCQVKIDVGATTSTTQQQPNWVVTSLDCDGNPKTVGGDEYYVAFTANASSKDRDDDVGGVKPYTAVAMVQDLQDGTYSLDFSATPTSPVPPDVDHGGTLTIFFQYSCGIGKMAPPSKAGWDNGGSTHTRYDISLPKNPPIRPFFRPNTKMPRSSNGELIDLSSMDLIVAFGDSTMEQFVRQRPNKKGKYYFQNNITLGEKVLTGLNSKTVSNLLDLLEECKGELLRGHQTYPKRALILGSCLWDILDSRDTLQGENYEDHQHACREYIRVIRERYPDVTIIWKSPMAVHIHVVELDRLVVSKMGEAALFGIERIRYMSASRSKALYDIQRHIIEQEGDVLFLDLYDATYLSGDWLFPSDGRHYRPDLNRLMLRWFYQPISISGDNARNGRIQVSSDGKNGMLLDIPKPYFIDPTFRS